MGEVKKERHLNPSLRAKQSNKAAATIKIVVARLDRAIQCAAAFRLSQTSLEYWVAGQAGDDSVLVSLSGSVARPVRNSQ
jgi:hypothetical protein